MGCLFLPVSRLCACWMHTKSATKANGCLWEITFGCGEKADLRQNFRTLWSGKELVRMFKEFHICLWTNFFVNQRDWCELCACWLYLHSGFPPHLENLENLEKQGPTWKTWKNRGFSSKNLEKYCKTWKKILTSPWKSPKDSIEKVPENFF